MDHKKQEVDINIKIDLTNHSASISKVKKVVEGRKIRVTLSVSQIAYLCKALKEVGVIKIKNVSELFRFVADNFSTPKASNISSESIRIKYYNPDTTTQRNIKDLVLKLLNFIQKDVGQK